MKPHTIALGFAFAALAACGPATRERGSDGDEDDDDALMVDAGDPSQCVPQAEICGNGYDDDCDNTVDCEDNDCSGVGSCPVCGEVETPLTAPLILPDGEPSSDIACNNDADCTVAGTECVARLCRIPYRSTLDFIGFVDGATLDDTSQFLSVCATMEHSWMRDLQVDLIPPSGQIITLHDFAGRTGGRVKLGTASAGDDGNFGTGYEYCWTAQAPQTWLQYANASMPTTLPAGDYKPFAPFAAMQGVPLNGDWTLRITDLWGADEGFLFEWTIAFDSSLVADCSGPIVGRTTHSGGRPAN